MNPFETHETAKQGNYGLRPPDYVSLVYLKGVETLLLVYPRAAAGIIKVPTSVIVQGDVVSCFFASGLAVMHR